MDWLLFSNTRHLASLSIMKEYQMGMYVDGHLRPYKLPAANLRLPEGGLPWQSLAAVPLRPYTIPRRAFASPSLCNIAPARLLVSSYFPTHIMPTLSLATSSYHSASPLSFLPVARCRCILILPPCQDSVALPSPTESGLCY